MTAICPWSGRSFQPLTRGGNEKKFADSAARAEAHKAARKFTENLIEQGFLTWDEVKRWYEEHGRDQAPSYTTRTEAPRDRDEERATENRNARHEAPEGVSS